MVNDNLKKKFMSLIVVMFFIAISVIGFAGIVTQNAPTSATNGRAQIQGRTTVTQFTSINGKVMNSNQYTTKNWAGYGFFNMPWYTFGQRKEICWVSEYVHVPTVSLSSQAGSATQCMSIWAALSSDHSGDNMWQAGIIENPYNGNVCMFQEHYYCGVKYGETVLNYGSQAHIEPGNNIYIYLSHKGNTFHAQINDLSNNCCYKIGSTGNQTFVTQSLSPTFFLSVIETPDLYGTIAALPHFSSFTVNSLTYYSGGECISGANSYSSGSYAKYVMQKDTSMEPNIDTHFSTSCSADGGYSATWIDSYD